MILHACMAGGSGSDPHSRSGRRKDQALQPVKTSLLPSGFTHAETCDIIEGCILMIL